MEQVLWFGWFRADIIAAYAGLFWRGLQMTILITLLCIVQGTALGLAVGLARVAESRHSPARQLCKYLLRWPASVFVSFFRGTPLFVQILLVHFAVMPLFINQVPHKRQAPGSDSQGARRDRLPAARRRDR